MNLKFKKIIAFVTAFNITFSAVCFSRMEKVYSAETQESKPAYGDLNDDGNVRSYGIVWIF